MQTEQLIAELKERYETALNGQQVVAIHLFAISYADELEGHSLADIAESATGRRSYGTELRKGVNLSPYVSVKENQ